MAEERDTLPCLGCATPLPIEATGCQICLRGRTKQEIVRGYTKLREEKARKRRRPFQILAAVLLIGAGAKLAATYRAKIAASAGAVTGAISRHVDDMRDPKYYAPRAAAPPASETPAPGAPVAPEDALRSQLMPPNPADAVTPPAAPAARPARSKPPAKNAWRVAGTVYDLATLDPVPGAMITFLRNDKEPVTATTDAKGAYEADLVKGDGWSVGMKMTAPAWGQPRYRRGQLLDIDPPYRDRDADERRAAMNAVTDGDMGAAPLEWARALSRVRLDLIAVPESWSEPPPR